MAKRHDREIASAIAAVEADAAKRGLKVSGSVLDIIADIRAEGAAETEPMPVTASRASRKAIKEMITAYREQLGDMNPAKDRMESFAHDHGMTGHRTELRAEYDRQFNKPKVGRARKKSAK